MYKNPLKIKAIYGKSSHSKAWRPHLIDHERSAVRIYEGEPGRTFYEVKFYCGPISPRQHVVTLDKLPDGVDVCAACVRYQKLRHMFGNKPVPRSIYHYMAGLEKRRQAPEAPF